MHKALKMVVAQISGEFVQPTGFYQLKPEIRFAMPSHDQKRNRRTTPPPSISSTWTRRRPTTRACPPPCSPVSSSRSFEWPASWKVLLSSKVGNRLEKSYDEWKGKGNNLDGAEEKSAAKRLYRAVIVAVRHAMPMSILDASQVGMEGGKNVFHLPLPHCSSKILLLL